MMSPDPFRRLRDDLNPPQGAKNRVFERISARIQEPESLALLRDSLSPKAESKAGVWAQVNDRISHATAGGFLAGLRQWLSPKNEADIRIKYLVMERIAVAHGSPLRVRMVKWTMAFAAFALIVRTSPLLFIAPQISASSAITIRPTTGAAILSADDRSQDIVRDTPLTAPATLVSGDGEVTVVLHAYGVIRLLPGTEVDIHDVASRPTDIPTITLIRGTLWVQGLLPSPLQGLTVRTAQGIVTVNEGSASIIREGDVTDVSVWNRKASIAFEGRDIRILTGERAEFRSGLPPRASKVDAASYDDPWIEQNLKRDAVHRREIAQWQRERRAASAGILPTSPLYPVKRVAEAMDMFLTFGEESRIYKRLQQAETRLNEAAALLGDQKKETPALQVAEALKLVASGAEVVALASGSGANPLVQSLLSEYKQAILQMASGSTLAGTGSTQSIVQEGVAGNAADLAAVLPDDESYLLKQTVLEATSQLPINSMTPPHVEDTVLIDTLMALQQQAGTGSLKGVSEALENLQPYLSGLSRADQRFNADTRREALSLLSSFATSVKERSEEEGDVDPVLLEGVTSYLPRKPAPPQPKPLPEAEIDAMVQAMYDRIFTYTLPRSRWNQLQQEFRTIDGHPDQGRILRRLYHVLPENGLATYVRTEIQQLRDRLAGQ